MRTLTINESRMVAGSGPGWDTADALGHSMQDTGTYVMKNGGPAGFVGVSLYGYGLAISTVAEANGGYGASYFNPNGGSGGGGGGGDTHYPPAGGGGGGGSHTTCTPGYQSAGEENGKFVVRYHEGQCVTTN